MNKIIKIFFLFFFIFIILAIAILSTSGFKTKKFNNFISQKINQNNENIKLNLKAIKFKLDISQVSLFLDTENPKIYYRNILIPSKNIKAYFDFLSLFKSETKINKVILNLDEINVSQLQMLARSFKPSNLKSFVNNKLKYGKINSEIELYLDKKNSLRDFIVRGKINDLNAKITSDINLKDSSFSFLADQTDLIVKNFFGKTEYFSIEEGFLNAELLDEIDIETNFNSIINYNGEFKKIDKFLSTHKNFKNFKNFSNVQAKLNNIIKFKFDKTYKLKNFEYRNNGKIINADFNPKELDYEYFSNKKIDKLSIVNTDIKVNFNSKENIMDLSGKYSLNDSKNLNFKMSNTIINESLNLDLTLDYDGILEIKVLNYFKKKGDIAKIKLNLKKNRNKITINQIDYNDDKNSIVIKKALFSEGKFLSLDEISVKTFKEDIKNNDFSILFKKNIDVRGENFDASNLPKILNKNLSNNFFSKISSDIEIDFKNINAPVSEKIKNFKLIGSIRNGKFIKISSKGDFGRDQFLDITMKNDQNFNKKYLEIYSDITKPLLAEYKFFRGLTGGKLLFSSIIHEKSSNSKLKIENFKVINAPGMIQLLSLADLGGLADLAEGDGISFDVLEINMEKNQDTLKLNEILALGPSISVLMEGYQDPNVTSLRGTLVPAKTLNTLISKIPVLGDIVIPKEVGEGLFGISFKMKGPPGQIKTTINPIRTITPRFIQKIIDKKRSNK